jgi:nucleoid DNA-binding protein
MTQDEIIEMAKEAGIIHPQMVAKHLEAFAKDIEAKLKEKNNG